MVQSRVERALERVLPAADHAPQRLHEAMRYAVLGGGKRVRPMLAFAAGELAASADSSGSTRSPARVELIHAYSLVHDDLPCMDDDVLRRGKPTVHVEFDEATALLVGDALQSLAFQLLAASTGSPTSPPTQLEMVQLLAAASGSRGMAGGQAIDLDAVGKALTLPELEFMHIHKTGALIRASVAARRALRQARSRGARARRSSTATPSASGSRSRWSTTCSTRRRRPRRSARPPGKDAAQGKPTYVSAPGPAARESARAGAASRRARGARRFGDARRAPAGARRFHRPARVLKAPGSRQQ